MTNVCDNPPGRKLTPEEEAELVLKARGGDERAFDRLWEAYQPVIRGHIRAKVWNDEDVEDVLLCARIDSRLTFATYDAAFALYTFFRWRADLCVRRYRRPLQGLREHELLGQTEEKPAGRSDPEADIQRLVCLEKALHLACSVGGSPHQSLVFLYRFLGERPREIVEELSDECLDDLADGAVDRFCLMTNRLPQAKRWIFQPLYPKLKQSVRKVTAPNTHPRLDYRGVLNSICGATRLGDYYPGVPEDNVSLWICQVAARVRAHMVVHVPECVPRVGVGPPRINPNSQASGDA